MTRFKSSAFAQYFATAVAMIGLGQVAVADEKWSGYFDTGFDISGPQGEDPTLLRGGQIRFMSSSGSSMFQFDMPFAPISNDSTDLKVGFNTAQAFVKHSYGNGVSWTLGQFDGIFGHERNDTVDLFFADHGALYSTQPVVNTGLAVGYELSKSMSLSAYATGSNGEGTTSLGDKPEFGAKLNMDMGVDLGVGGYYQKLTDTTKIMYLNATAGHKVAGIDLGLEVSYAKAGDADAGLGYCLTGTTKVWGELEGGVRAEMLNKFDNHKEMEITAGVRQAMGKNLTVKANYVFDSVTATDGATAVTDHSGVVAAVYGF